MDISGYIQDLLWEYECVIIPGFGGIMATYRPAEMVLAEHTIYPPSKSLAFNEYLTSNDGLLVNYLFQKSQISYTEAVDQIDAWVKKTKSLLAANEEIYLPKIGRFHRDVERNLRFEPDTTVNYLASAYGLRKVIAEPILRSKSAETIEVMETHRTSYTLPRANKTLAMAAAILAFLTLGTVSSLMYRGDDIKPLNLNAANVLGFLEHFNGHKEAAPEPKLSINEALPHLSTDVKGQISSHLNPSKEAKEPLKARAAQELAPVKAPMTEAGSATGRKYYIIVGAFKDRSNFDKALARLKVKYPNEEIYEEASSEIKRVGFYAGDSYQHASETLKEARKEQKECWLLKK